MICRRTTTLLGALLVVGCDPMQPPATTPQASPPTASAPAVEPEAPAVEPERSVPTPPMFAIGGGEADAHTHISFETPRTMVAASVRVVVDRAAPVGLNFFALQVDFNNDTWAHGGLQDVDGPNGTRKHQVNWGGLVDRGGGTADYEKEDDRADLEKIQNPVVGQHVGPYAWRTGVTYELRIERGARVTLPPGDYQLIPDRPKVHVDHARAMWEWRFTARPVSPPDSGPGELFVAVLHDAADSFNSFYVWNESGYGSTSEAQHTSWWTPRYRAIDAASEQAPAAWGRF
ncbi:MAG: hypothetical protein NT062_20405 [Proteobacteria bacterium]|nr:hypothetical protein [Pseudomonadota bacterium]